MRRGGRVHRLGEGRLNVALYKRRMRLSIEPFLLDADRLAADAGKRA